MEITYDYYRIFYYVALQKSFSGAAAILGSNQPNITKYINNLEAQLGCKLFSRTNRGVSMTPEGEKLFSHVAVAYEQLHNAELELANDKSLVNGIIRVGASETALHGALLPAIKQFHRKYPGIHLNINNHSTPEALKALQNGLVDFAVVTSPTDAPAQFRETSLSVFHEVLVGGEGYEALQDKTLTPDDLALYPKVGLSQNTKTYAFYSQEFGRLGFVWKPDTEAATTDQLLPMIENGLGIGFVPDFMLEQFAHGNRVFRIGFNGITPVRDIVLVENKTRHLSIAATELKNVILDMKQKKSYGL